MDLQYLQYRVAYTLEKMGRDTEALAAYERMYTRPIHPNDDYAGRALYRTGRIYRDHLGQPALALDVWRATVLAFPDTNFADDALLDLSRHYRNEGNIDGLIEEYSGMFEQLRDREIADNLLYDTARALHDDAGRCLDALVLYDLLEINFPRSSYVDDAIWRKSTCYREHGRTDDEYKVLRDFVDGREKAVIFADYDYAYYNPALRRMAEIHEERGELHEAIFAYRTFQKMFRLSLDSDDVQFIIINLYDQLGDVGSMRTYSNELRRNWPESRYVTRAEELVRAAEARR